MKNKDEIPSTTATIALKILGCVWNYISGQFQQMKAF
jgi:hypothetical protein